MAQPSQLRIQPPQSIPAQNRAETTSAVADTTALRGHETSSQTAFQNTVSIRKVDRHIKKTRTTRDSDDRPEMGCGIAKSNRSDCQTRATEYQHMHRTKHHGRAKPASGTTTFAAAAGCATSHLSRKNESKQASFGKCTPGGRNVHRLHDSNLPLPHQSPGAFSLEARRWPNEERHTRNGHNSSVSTKKTKT